MAASVATPPYDVVSLAESKQLAGSNPNSFLRVSRAELELPAGIDPYSDEVYEHGAKNLRKMLQQGVLVRENEPILGIYRQTMGDHIQTGIVGLALVDEYDDGTIVKHELTRPAKEQDRAHLIEVHDSQSGPVYLVYRQSDALSRWIDKITAAAPDVDFTAEDGVQHTTWMVRDQTLIAEGVAGFENLSNLYIADGHHRSAAASRVRRDRNKPSGFDVETVPENGFLVVVFSDDSVQILPYNRVVRDLNGHTPESFLAAIGENFNVVRTEQPSQPPAQGFDFYLGDGWYRATPHTNICETSDAVKSLAVSILTDHVLDPILGIEDQRTSDRIDFIGGIRGLDALTQRVDSGQWAVAFWLYPTTVEQLMAVGDADQIMPPKSTWFEPKLRDGLFVHLLSG